SIGNGVQVLQAADTGISSLQKLVDTAKSIASQALQQPVGYSTKSNVQFTGTGVPSGPGVATNADITTSKLNGGVFTFTNQAGTRLNNPGRPLAFSFQSRDQDGTGPIGRPIEPGAGGRRSQSLGHHHRT